MGLINHSNSEIALQIAVAAINKVNYDSSELSEETKVQVDYLVELGVHAYYQALKELDRQLP
ncbi:MULTISPECIES: hypothetical protein [Paenibacillus]|uniref:hypothetical protein n=1 Tax=Paenibacillus TaxID=44249 RepID=UPI0028FD3E08|nr:hypothetical protein [Paenibacillus sp. 3LSP]MDU0332567.1 hypothetical protein [Paenibacillus sp. 3LSP]